MLPPIFIATAILYIPSPTKKDNVKKPARILASTLGVFIIALIVVAAGHGFSGLFHNLRGMNLRSGVLVGMSHSLLGKIPLPLPSMYVDALDYLLIKKAAYFDYYLNGSLSKDGWSQYFIVAAALKYPVPLLILVAVSVGAFFRNSVKFAERAMWIPIVCVFALFSFFLKVDSGVRYLLPAMPFLIVLASGRLAEMFSSDKKAIRNVAALLIIWHGSSFVKCPGNALAYFNELAGGPAGGIRYLVESNLDWGQNLVRLKRYADKNDLKPLLIYNYGLVPPQAYGMRAGWVPCEPTKAVVAISVNYLNGLDPFQKRPKECFEWLRKMKPVARLGEGLYVYDTRNIFP